MNSALIPLTPHRAVYQITFHYVFERFTHVMLITYCIAWKERLWPGDHLLHLPLLLLADLNSYD